MLTIRVQKIKRNKTKHKKEIKTKQTKTQIKKTKKQNKTLKKKLFYRSNGAYQQNNMHLYSWLKNLNLLF